MYKEMEHSWGNLICLKKHLSPETSTAKVIYAFSSFLSELIFLHIINQFLNLKIQYNSELYITFAKHAIGGSHLGE